MEKSKIKNFILILLALVNVFLLFIVVSNACEEKKAEASRMAALDNILSENGISLAPDVTLPDTVPAQISLKRDMDDEHGKISSLIGSCTVSDEGGNIFFYDGSNGKARFRGTGEFEILIDAGVIKAGKDPVGAAKSALKKLGIEYGNIEPKVTSEGDNTEVILSCSWDGTAIYNAQVTFNFSGNNLQLIRGKLPFDSKVSVQSSEKYPDSVTVLMGYLQSIRDTGSVCSEINGLDIQYQLNSTISGSCILKPVWCITTNSGSYYIDAETGKAESFGSAS